MAEIPEQRFGDFRVGIESRLTGLETEIESKSGGIADLRIRLSQVEKKFWYAMGAISAVAAIVAVLGIFINIFFLNYTLVPNELLDALGKN